MLKPGDDALRLGQLGLPVKPSRGRNPVSRFPQPCAALCQDRTCRIYRDRPLQCQEFECGVLKEAKAGLITYAAGFREVRKTRRKVDEVRRLLRELGDTDEHRALGERFRRTSKRMEAGGISDASKDKYSDLTQAVHHLKLQLGGKFYLRSQPEK